MGFITWDPQDWRAASAGEEGAWRYDSEEKRSSVFISVLPARVPRDRLLEVATTFADKRRDAELRTRSDRSIRFGDSWVEPTNDGEAGYIAYAGHDDHTVFRVMGWITQAKILSLTVETETRDSSFARAVADEVLDGFRPYLP